MKAVNSQGNSDGKPTGGHLAKAFLLRWSTFTDAFPLCLLTLNSCTFGLTTAPLIFKVMDVIILNYGEQGASALKQLVSQAWLNLIDDRVSRFLILNPRAAIIFCFQDGIAL